MTITPINNWNIISLGTTFFYAAFSFRDSCYFCCDVVTIIPFLTFSSIQSNQDLPLWSIEIEFYLGQHSSMRPSIFEIAAAISSKFLRLNPFLHQKCYLTPGHSWLSISTIKVIPSLTNLPSFYQNIIYLGVCTSMWPSIFKIIAIIFSKPIAASGASFHCYTYGLSRITFFHMAFNSSRP